MELICVTKQFQTDRKERTKNRLKANEQTNRQYTFVQYLCRFTTHMQAVIKQTDKKANN